jgi:anti-anti-sigma factor
MRDTPIRRAKPRAAAKPLSRQRIPPRPRRGSARRCVAVLHDGDGYLLRLLQEPPCYPRLDAAAREARRVIAEGARRLAIDREARRVIAEGARRLAIDLTPVRELDGASIGELIGIREQLARQGGSLRLLGVHPWVRHMLEIAGVLRFVGVDADLSRAPQPVALTG